MGRGVKNGCKTLKNIDIFGYEVNLKWQGEKSTRKSILGGLFSIIALAIVLSNGLSKFRKVNSTNENDAKIYEYDMTIDEIKPIYYEQT